MSFNQYILHCKQAVAHGIAADDHPEGRDDCIVIVGERDGVVAWHSHATDSLDPFERANQDHPVEDRRP